jgi:tetratricopeptide (TPR) repeat protein
MPVGKVGKEEKLTSEQVEALVPFLSQMSFGKLLKWLLRDWGARPDGQRERWLIKEFGSSVGYDPTGRAVGNWLRDKNFPTDSADIQRALFGDNTLYDPWRVVLAHALAKARPQKTSQPQLQTAQHHVARPFVGVPPPIEGFAGRLEDLTSLDKMLTQDSRVVVAAVAGMGGVGKTALAAEYAHRFRNSYAGIWWCPAQTEDSLLTALAALAAVVGVVRADASDVREAANAALAWLKLPRRAKWLLVYDNVTKPEDIEDFLPTSATRVMITSRFSDWSGWASSLALDVFSPDVAAGFLLDRTKRPDAAGARFLAETLGCLPLALDHAAAICRRTLLSFAEFAAKAEKLIARAPRSVRYPKSVFATFNIAIQEAAKNCPAAETLMSFLAYCAPERVPRVLVDGALDDAMEQQEAVCALAEVSLIKHCMSPDGTAAIIVHRLVQSVARARSEENGTAQRVVEQLTTRFTAVYPSEPALDPQYWSLCAELGPHLSRLRKEHSRQPSQNTQWPDLLTRAGAYYFHRAFFDLAKSHLTDALSIREMLLGPQHPDTAKSLENLADLLAAQANFVEARPLLERVVAIREKVFGPEHADTAASLHNLAVAAAYQSDNANARHLLERAFAVRQKVLGPEHPDTAHSLDNLVTVLHIQGNFAEATKLHKSSLAATSKVLSEEHQDISVSLDNLDELANSLAKQRDFGGARSLLNRTLETRLRVHGPQHPETAINLYNLAKVLAAQGDFAGAHSLVGRALMIFEKLFGPEHPEIAAMLDALAALFVEQNDLLQAQAHLARALAIREKVLGPEHPETSDSLDGLANVLAEQGDFATAHLLYVRAAAIREKVFGPQHPATASSLQDVAAMLSKLGDVEASRSLHERIAAIYEVGLGSQHPLTAVSLNNQAHLLVEQGDLAGARQLYERVLAIFEKTHGPNHPHVIPSLYNLAYLLIRQGELDKARPLYERSVAIHEHVFGPEHSCAAESLVHFADALANQGRLHEAQPLYERSLAIHEKVSGPTNPETAMSLARLSTLFFERGDFDRASSLMERANAIVGLRIVIQDD